MITLNLLIVDFVYPLPSPDHTLAQVIAGLAFVKAGIAGHQVVNRATALQVVMIKPVISVSFEPSLNDFFYVHTPPLLPSLSAAR